MVKPSPSLRQKPLKNSDSKASEPEPCMDSAKIMTKSCSPESTTCTSGTSRIPQTLDDLKAWWPFDRLDPKVLQKLGKPLPKHADVEDALL